MSKALSVNRLGWKLLDKLIENSDLYGVKVEKSGSGTVIVDAGINAKGGFQAGKIITEICMGGCGKARIAWQNYAGLQLLSIMVHTDHPVIATLGSQYAGWQISEDDYFAIGSGPARALALKPKAIYEEIRYADEFDKAIVVLETDKRPPPKLVNRFVKDCKVSPENLAIIVTPTASVAGAVQVSGRMVETGIHKLRKLGFDPRTILYASGCAPIPPVHHDFTRAMARTNDAILYGGIAYYTVEYDDEEELERIAQKAPSKASRIYGKPFIEIFREADHDFYKIDANLFAPAVLIIDNVKTGATLSNGEINTNMLKESFGFKDG